MENISTKIYSASGKESGSVELPGAIWGLPWNADLVHQVVTGMQANARANTANAKGRGEVRGGGKKPWRQKGTGRARHGSSRSPIWIGGGTTHGPSSDKNYDKKINKKMRAKALFVTLSQKLRDGQVLFVDKFDFTAIKTKDAQKALNNLEKVAGFETINTKKDNNILVFVPGKNETVSKSFRNISHVTLEDARNMNAADIVNFRYIVVANPDDTNTMLASKLNIDVKAPAKAPKAKKVAVKKVAAKKKASAKKAK